MNCHAGDKVGFAVDFEGRMLCRSLSQTPDPRNPSAAMRLAFFAALACLFRGAIDGFFDIESVFFKGFLQSIMPAPGAFTKALMSSINS